MPEIGHDHTRNIVCPHCYHEDRDSWDRGSGIGETPVNIECGYCGETFSAMRYVRISYSTKKITKETDNV